jgi:hypothetical protein
VGGWLGSFESRHLHRPDHDVLPLFGWVALLVLAGLIRADNQDLDGLRRAPGGNVGSLLVVRAGSTSWIEQRPQTTKHQVSWFILMLSIKSPWRGFWPVFRALPGCWAASSRPAESVGFRERHAQLLTGCRPPAFLGNSVPGHGVKYGVPGTPTIEYGVRGTPDQIAARRLFPTVGIQAS